MWFDLIVGEHLTATAADELLLDLAAAAGVSEDDRRPGGTR
jgi:hypothetical protein